VSYSSATASPNGAYRNRRKRSGRACPAGYPGRTIKARLLFAATFILIGVGIGVFAGAVSGSEEVRAASVQPVKEIVVLEGDTLWSIANKHAPEGESVGVYVRKLMAANGLRNSLIKAGQTLVLP